MADKEEIIIDRANILKEKINMCFILLSNKLETPETIEQTIYEHLDTFVRYWNAQLASKTQECEDLKEKNALLESQMAFNLSEMEIRLGNEVNRSETLLKELKRLDKIKDEYREMSENLKAEEKFLKQCCQKAGEELAKHSFDYDGKEKNLVVQAMELNEKYEKFKKALAEIEEIVNEACTESQSDCKSCNSSCEHKDILDIIRKARRMTNDNSINTN